MYCIVYFHCIVSSNLIELTDAIMQHAFLFVYLSAAFCFHYNWCLQCCLHCRRCYSSKTICLVFLYFFLHNSLCIAFPAIFVSICVYFENKVSRDKSHLGQSWPINDKGIGMIKETCTKDVSSYYILCFYHHILRFYYHILCFYHIPCYTMHYITQTWSNMGSFLYK